MSKLFLNRLLTSALRTLINITLKYNIIFTSFIKDTIIILRDCNQQVILGSPKKKKKKVILIITKLFWQCETYFIYCTSYGIPLRKHNLRR